MLTNGGNGGAAKYLALHEFKGPEFLDTVQWKHAIDTPWRNSIIERIKKENWERGMFTFYHDFNQTPV